jgi:hypothetical protein
MVGPAPAAGPVLAAGRGPGSGRAAAGPPGLPRRSKWAVAAFAAGVAGAILLVILIAAAVSNSNGLGIASVIIGIAGALPAGLITGITALVRIRRRRLRGTWLAVSGLAVTGIWAVFLLIGILAS